MTPIIWDPEADGEPIRYDCKHHRACLQFAVRQAQPVWPGWACPVGCPRKHLVIRAAEVYTGSGLSGDCEVVE